jgi:hypothetical protein
LQHRELFQHQDPLSLKYQHEMHQKILQKVQRKLVMDPSQNCYFVHQNYFKLLKKQNKKVQQK